MSTKFSRKTFLKGSVAGLGMMALNVCTAGAASAAEPAAAAAEDTNSLNLVPKKAASVKVTSRGSVSGGWQGEPVFPKPITILPHGIWRDTDRSKYRTA